MRWPEFSSSDPCTGEELWRGVQTDPAAIDTAVRAARDAFPRWAARLNDERVAVLRGYQQVVAARADAFASLIARETGKPLWECRGEVASVIAKVDVSLVAQAERAGARTKDKPDVRECLRHKPHGVLGVLGPFNFPAHLPNGHIVPALLAGNAVVFKPSEQTPAVAEFMVDCWREAGLPAELLALVQGGREAGEALSGHAGLDGLLFTGSSATGLHLARQYAATPHKLLALELGGNNPIVAWDIAEPDLENAALLIAQSAYQTAGQRCTSARRLIVDDARADRLLDALVDLIDRLQIGPPFAEPQPFMGPVIDNRAADRLIAAAGALIDDGAKVIRPLGRTDDARPFLSPGLYDVTTASRRRDEEHFGPLLQIVRTSSFDAAITEANDTCFGLAASLIGGTQTHYDGFWTGVRAGVVNWNRPTGGAASTLPFGGAGRSGNHRPSAYYACDYCARPVASLEAERPVAAAVAGLVQR